MKSNNPNTETEPNRNVIMAGGLALNVSCNILKSAITHIGLFISIFTFGQVGYFEFNNPYAIEVTEEVINQLTSNTWFGSVIVDYGRHDTIKTKFHTRLRYNEDFTYTVNNLYSEKWTIVQKKYLDHTVIDSLKSGLGTRFGGIFGIIEINDTVLHLIKLQTTTHDMQRHLYFVNEPQLVTLTSTIESNNSEAETHFETDDYNKGTKPNAIFIEDPTPEQLDSISNLRMEELFFYNISTINDSILIQTKDTLFKIEWNRK